MVKILEIKKLRKELNVLLEENNSTVLESDIDLEKKSSGLDISYVNDIFYEDYFSKISNSYFRDLEEDTEIKLKGTGNINLIIKNDLRLVLRLLDSSFLNINIFIWPGVSLDLYEISKSSQLNKNLFFHQSENSEVNYYQALFSSKFNSTSSYLKENSKFNAISGYYIDKDNCYHNIKSIHLSPNSKSDIKINGSVKGGASVVSDGLVNIRFDSENSEGYQKLYGLILDQDSKISSEPILEIENNNVKCSHGASISQISNELKFYLKSRGIKEEQINSLVVQGFFGNFMKDYYEDICSYLN